MHYLFLINICKNFTEENLKKKKKKGIKVK